MRDLVLARVMLSFCASSSSSCGSMLPKNELTLMASSLDCRCDGAIRRISDSTKHRGMRRQHRDRRAFSDLSAAIQGDLPILVAQQLGLPRVGCPTDNILGPE